MASNLKFVEYVIDQIDASGTVEYRKMFGEFVLYRGRKVVALICDNQLYVKRTAGGEAFVGEVTWAAPYPGAKQQMLMDDELEDPQWLGELIDITEKELPEPKPKKKKAKKSKKK